MDETKTNTMTQAPPIQEQRAPQASPPAAAAPEHAKSSRPLVKRILIILGVAILGFAIWELFFAAPRVPESIVVLSGRIEGDDSAVAPKTSGKILEVTVREGDTVTAG